MRFTALFFSAAAYLAVNVAAQCNQTGAAPGQNFIGSTPSQRHVIDSQQANAIISAAAAEASSANLPSNIAVTDPSGNLVAFLKTDNAFPGSTDISIRKAKTVGLFNGIYTTGALYNITQPGTALYSAQYTNGGLVVFGGGLPVYVNGYFIGAVGVSGGTAEQDVQVATAGVNAIGPVPDWVVTENPFSLVTGQAACGSSA
ncbi:hypothetical protein H2203_008678 [Taxawa tesnikishii (nom. ined.)]|nr:hypothetical protein H2203_008678 [Dothideales sp. JES 119]